MKRNLLYIALLLSGILLLLSCGKEPAGGIPPAPAALTARIEGVSFLTKTSYDTEGPVGDFLWTAGDKVAVHYSDGNYASLAVDPLTGALNAPSTAARYRDYYAVYPPSAVVADHYGNPTLKVTLPASYDIADIVAGTSTLPAEYSLCPLVAVNDMDSDIMEFYHVGGLLRLTLLNIAPSASRVYVIFEKDVTGTYTVLYPDTTEPVIQTAGETSGNEVAFTVAGDAGVGSPAPTVVLNVPVPCGSYGVVRVETRDSKDVVRDAVNLKYDMVFRRHYGKRFWILFSRNVTFGTQVNTNPIDVENHDFYNAPYNFEWK